tara:strand:- start:14666 stop:15325 length:660 start_codon:yes stop_codon:yes gene_type:complete
MGASTAGKKKGGSGGSGGQYGGGEIDKEAMQTVSDKVAVTKAADTAKKNEIASGNQMYGGAVSTAINEKLVELGYAKKTGGGGYWLSSEGWKMKYGSYTPGQAQTGSAMGTGDHKGVLTSTAISQEMLQSQNKLKAVALGALSMGMPGIGATAMRLDAGKSLKDAATPEKAHAEYMTQFKAKISGKKPPKKSTIISDTLGVVKATLGSGNDTKKTELGQ